MAKATSKTSTLEVQSPVSGESRLVFQRTFVSSTKVGNRYITASKNYALFDTSGRRYERESELALKCLSSGERFHVVGHADSIRKAKA